MFLTGREWRPFESLYATGNDYLNMIYVFKGVKKKSNENISIKSFLRETRSSGKMNDILLDVVKSRTVSFRNSFYIRATKLRKKYSISIQLVKDYQLKIWRTEFTTKTIQKLSNLFV